MSTFIFFSVFIIQKPCAMHCLEHLGYTEWSAGKYLTITWHFGVWDPRVWCDSEQFAHYYGVNHAPLVHGELLVMFKSSLVPHITDKSLKTPSAIPPLSSGLLFSHCSCRQEWPDVSSSPSISGTGHENPSSSTDWKPPYHPCLKARTHSYHPCLCLFFFLKHHTKHCLFTNGSLRQAHLKTKIQGWACGAVVDRALA